MSSALKPNGGVGVQERNSPDGRLFQQYTPRFSGCFAPQTSKTGSFISNNSIRCIPKSSSNGYQDYYLSEAGLGMKSSSPRVRLLPDGGMHSSYDYIGLVTGSPPAAAPIVNQECSLRPTTQQDLNSRRGAATNAQETQRHYPIESNQGFACSCGELFRGSSRTAKANLKRHVESSNKNTPHSCPNKHRGCPYTTSRKDNVESHLKSCRYGDIADKPHIQTGSSKPPKLESSNLREAVVLAASGDFGDKPPDKPDDNTQTAASRNKLLRKSKRSRSERSSTTSKPR